MNRIHTLRFATPVVIASSLVCACASMPQGTLSYNYPKAETQVVVTQTLACNAAGDSVRQVVDVSSRTTYTSDLAVAPGDITPSALSGSLTDTDLSFTFTDDGRLSGVNVSQTGQGTAIVKDIISIAKAAVAVAGASGGVFDPQGACKRIATLAPSKGTGASKSNSAKTDGAKGTATSSGDSDPPPTPTVTLTYAGSFTYAKEAPKDQADPNVVTLKLRSEVTKSAMDRLDLQPDVATQALDLQLRPFLPRLGYTILIDLSSKRYRGVRWSGATPSDISLKLNSIANASLTLHGPVNNLNTVDEVWRGSVAVPLTGTEDLYLVPIPKASAFGSQKFSIGLTEAGAINKIGYAKTASADAADSAAAIGGALSGGLTKPTDAQMAASAQAKADLIYQQQRLAACLAIPSTCPK